MKYDKVSEVMFDDLNDWMLSKHSIAIRTMYTIFIEEYLRERFGQLNDKAHKEMVRNLLGRLIS
jgi:hypothetical protein